MEQVEKAEVQAVDQQEHQLLHQIPVQQVLEVVAAVPQQEFLELVDQELL